MVPALGLAPEGAVGTDPIPPGRVISPVFVLPPLLPEPLLLQAARAVTLASVTASPAIAFLLRSLIGPPSLRVLRLVSVLRSSACRPALAVLPVIRRIAAGGTGSQ